MRRGIAVFVTAIVVVLAAGGVFVLTHGRARETAAMPPPAPPAVPVVAGTVISRDVPIYLRGIGTVIAYNNVVVRSQIPGQIIKIAFTQGQTVKVGDMLAEIDPRPYQAQLDQAIANRDRDQAQLTNRSPISTATTNCWPRAMPRSSSSTPKRHKCVQLQSAIKSDEAIIEAAKVQLDYTKLTSPIDGVTGIRQVDQGNIIHPTDPNGLVVVTQIQPISVIFTLPETDFAGNPAADGQGAAHGPRLQPGRQDQARPGQARSHQQPDRPDHRHHPAQGRLSQHGAYAVAGRAHQCAAAARDPA